jgi:hypothetical protein
VLRRLLRVCLAGLAVWLVAELGARWYLHQALSHGWPTQSGALSEVRKAIRDHPQNEAARRIETLAAGLAIDIIPRGQSRQRPSSQVDVAAWKAVEQTVKDYVAQAVTASERRSNSAPQAFVSYLTDRSANFSALVTQLEAGGPPSWEVRSSAGFDAPLPNLLGHLSLVRLLVAAALNSASVRDNHAAWQDLHAASILTEPLFERPDLISQLVGYAEANLIIGGMRQVEGAPDWSLQWPGLNLQVALTRATTADAWPIYEPFTRSLFSDLFTVFADKEHPPTLGGRLLSLVLGPYLVASAANTAIVHRTSLQRYSSLPACDQRIEIITTDAIPRWNIFGRVAFPELGGSYERLQHLLAHIDGTRQLLTARRQRQHSRAWPEAPPPFQTICHRSFWAYELHGDRLYLHALEPIVPLKSKGAINLSPQFSDQ